MALFGARHQKTIVIYHAAIFRHAMHYRIRGHRSGCGSEAGLARMRTWPVCGALALARLHDAPDATRRRS